jgi:hypothetical protein
MKTQADLGGVVINEANSLHPKPGLRLNISGKGRPDFPRPDDGNTMPHCTLACAGKKALTENAHAGSQNGHAKKRENEVNNDDPSWKHGLTSSCKPEEQLDSSGKGECVKNQLGIGKAEKCQKAAELTEQPE